MDDESEEDGTELDGHLLEEDGKLADIKGLTFVHTAAKDVRTISQEVTDGLDHSPGTHVGRDAGLVGELEVMEAQGFSKQADDNPIKLFQYQGGYTHTAMVL